MKYNLIYLISLLLVLSVACKKEELPINPEMVVNKKYPPIVQPDSIVYRTPFPEGKLPFPFHNPEWESNELSKAMNKLFIVNNFGEFQSGDTKESAYFHDGLDIVLSNGTPIFAVSKGIVRAIIGSPPYYMSIIIEDLEHPGMAWSYTHVYYFAVKKGDVVAQGQYLARVNFKGLDHIHLSRSKLRKDGNWFSYFDIINIYPNDYFELEDHKPPVISTPFHYFRNNTDTYFTSDSMPTLSGDVDIVVSMRDATDYSRGSLKGSGYFGDRLAVKSISYRILKDGKEVFSAPSFDFSKLEFDYADDKWRKALTVYKMRTILEEAPLPYDKFFSHYVITNARPGYKGIISPEDKNLAWNTGKKDAAGKPLFPNGVYTIEVTAYDNGGNSTTVQDSVRVKN